MRALLAFAVLAGLPASAAAFDCKKAATPSEKAICADPAALAADAAMSAAFQALLQSAPASQRPQIAAAQARWLPTRDGHCTDSGEAAARVTRVPPGHPEGYLEGFANVYSEVALAIKAARSGKKPPDGVHFPTIEDGVKGLAFVEAAVRSSKANGAWVKL